MRHHLLLLAAFFLWSTSGPLFRVCGLSTANYIVFSSTVGLLALLCFYGRRVPRSFAGVPRGPLLRVSAFGAFNIWAAFQAFQMTTIGNVLVLHYTAPILVALFEPAILGERFSLRTIPILTVSTIGLIFFAWREIAVGDTRDLMGIALAAISALSYAAVIILSRDLARVGVDPIALTVAPSAFLLICVLPFIRLDEVTTSGLVISFGAGILHLSIAAMFYMMALRHVRASTAAIMGYLEIVFGLGWGFLFFGEAISATKVVGAALITAAGLALILDARRVGGDPALTQAPGI